MLPYFILILLILHRWSTPGFYKTISAIFLSSIIGWGVLPLHFNNYIRALESNNVFSLNSTRITKAFSRSNIESIFFIKTENSKESLKAKIVPDALTYIRNNYHESVEVFDRYSLIDAEDPYPPWNALYGPANFGELPSEIRQQYLKNIKNRFKRSGWILFDKDYKKEMDAYLADYDAIYDRDIALDFGFYKAIRFIPKN